MPYDSIYDALDRLYDAIGRGILETFLEGRYPAHHQNMRYGVSNLLIQLKRSPPDSGDQQEIERMAVAIRILEDSVMPQALDERNELAVRLFYQALQGIELWLDSCAGRVDVECPFCGSYMHAICQCSKSAPTAGRLP